MSTELSIIVLLQLSDKNIDMRLNLGLKHFEGRAKNDSVAATPGVMLMPVPLWLPPSYGLVHSPDHTVHLKVYESICEQ